jgi:hypothetical protein
MLDAEGFQRKYCVSRSAGCKISYIGAGEFLPYINNLYLWLRRGIYGLVHLMLAKTGDKFSISLLID